MIGITAATGQLGRLVIKSLLERGTPANQIAALVRKPEKASDLAAQGIQIRHADYLKPETLSNALQGIEKLLLISSGDTNNRSTQHLNVIKAAKTANVALVAYTSILNADTTKMLIAADHQATETNIKASGIPYVFLRNGWYNENYTSSIAQTLEHGVLLGSAGNGELNPAARQDFAEAAAVVLSSQAQENKIYELAGDQSISLTALAAEISHQSGKPVIYQDLPAADYSTTLTSFGLPQEFANILADADIGIARGDLSSQSRDLSILIGRATTQIKTSIATAIKG